MKTSPPFLYGTAWKEASTAECVGNALRAGFRGIDTANQRKHYFEVGVGEAISEWISAGLGKRQDLFLQTKFTSIDGQDHRLPYDSLAPYSKQVEQSFATSLEHLGTDYIDSYVLHGPTSRNGVNEGDLEIWRAMEVIAESDRTRFLGLSNVSLDQLETFYREAKIKPKFVQNRCFARTGWDREIRKFCQSKKITYQGFSLLTANPPVVAHPEFRGIAERTECTPAQVIFAFARQVGMLPLTGTTDPVHMREDLESVRRCPLTEADVSWIESILL